MATIHRVSSVMIVEITAYGESLKVIVTMGPSKLSKKYHRRILSKLSQIVEAAKEAGLFPSGPVDMHTSDDYRWSFIVRRKEDDEWDDERNIDVTFKICDSREYDGTRDGYNWMLDIVEIGGSIVGSWAPYNYSPNVWTKDADELEMRFCAFEEGYPEETLAPILERFNRKAKVG